ncbi:hypothetical protein ORS3428_13890 [Mesorhizobium sp. ORS 3428]|nr:hypothetical protein ORS3428_13890 [Mesorhizobium sp. ORS 3428]
MPASVCWNGRHLSKAIVGRAQTAVQLNVRFDGARQDRGGFQPFRLFDLGSGDIERRLMAPGPKIPVHGPACEPCVFKRSKSGYCGEEPYRDSGGIPIVPNAALLRDMD